jgi:transcriptional regulator with XRE-family HTH domain
MAKLITRTWTTTGILGRKLRRTAYGYTLMVNGRRERTVNEDWTKDEALAELVKRQAALAERARLTRAYVTRLEAGQQDPSLSTITALAKALGVAPGGLLR